MMFFEQALVIVEVREGVAGRAVIGGAVEGGADGGDAVDEAGVDEAAVERRVGVADLGGGEEAGGGVRVGALIDVNGVAILIEVESAAETTVVAPLTVMLALPPLKVTLITVPAGRSAAAVKEKEPSPPALVNAPALRLLLPGVGTHARSVKRITVLEPIGARRTNSKPSIVVPLPSVCPVL